MSRRVRRTALLLTALDPVAFGQQLVIPSGNYSGASEELGIPAEAGNVSWGAPTYFAQFSADQLEAVGMKEPPAFLVSSEYDVTEFVRLGQLVAS